jgi:[ribosomal protein S5]-alanine N-acetyltransferase
MTRQIYIRQLALADQPAFLSAARKSRALHHPWTSAPATPSQFADFVERMVLPTNHCFLVCTRDSDEIAGVINLTNIVLGAFRSGYLGYYAFAGFEGQGLMREGLRAVMRHAFSKLKLHRLEANIQPSNAASIALVRTCGFNKEGYSPRYLKIAGDGAITSAGQFLLHKSRNWNGNKDTGTWFKLSERRLECGVFLQRTSRFGLVNGCQNRLGQRQIRKFHHDDTTRSRHRSIAYKGCFGNASG